MNPNELKLEELKQAEAQIKAEIARANAELAQTKADELQAAQPTEESMLAYTRGLQGNRDAEGNMITEKQMAVPAGFHEMEDGTLMADDEMETESSMSMEEAMASLVMKSKTNFDSYKDKGTIGDAAEAAGMSRVDFVMSPEFQAVYGNKYDEDAQPLKIPVAGDESNLEGQALEDALDKKMQEIYDIDINVRKDSESAKMREGSTGMQDRATPRKDETPSRSMGMTEDEGGTSSVNQKDDFWKTEEGYNKAIEMYGDKPSWVKEPTMMFNPETQKYEKIKEEDKEQFEDLGISADIKRMFG